MYRFGPREPPPPCVDRVVEVQITQGGYSRNVLSTEVGAEAPPGARSKSGGRGKGKSGDEGEGKSGKGCRNAAADRSHHETGLLARPHGVPRGLAGARAVLRGPRASLRKTGLTVLALSTRAIRAPPGPQRLALIGLHLIGWGLPRPARLTPLRCRRRARAWTRTSRIAPTACWPSSPVVGFVAPLVRWLVFGPPRPRGVRAMRACGRAGCGMGRASALALPRRSSFRASAARCRAAHGCWHAVSAWRARGPACALPGAGRR